MLCVLYFLYFVYFIVISPCNSVRLSYWIKDYLLTYLLSIVQADVEMMWMCHLCPVSECWLILCHSWSCCSYCKWWWRLRLQWNCIRWQTEASSYLANPDRCLGMLHEYPLVKSAFIHFNTTMPSSAQLNGSLALAADKLRQLDGTGCQTSTLKNFFCLKLVPLMFEILNMWTAVITLTQ